MATLPNSGSTAFARLMQSSENVALIYRNGEGQWLVPELRDPSTWWKPEHQMPFDKAAFVWASRLAWRAPDAPVVFEKSPPNIIRMTELRAALSQYGRTEVISFARDPVAVCASWARRYGPKMVAKKTEDGLPPKGAEFFRLLGQHCGELSEYLDAARSQALLHVSYEEMVEDPVLVAERLSDAIPELGPLDPDVKVRVKSYPAQALRNMNAEQRASLSSEELTAVLEGLGPYKPTFKRLGYELH